MDLEELLWLYLWLYLLGLGHQMAFPQKSTKSPSLTSLTFWKTLHTFTNLSPTCREMYIQILDQTAISTDSYHPGSNKAQERLRRGSPEIILAGSAVRQSFHANYVTKNSYVSYAVWSGTQAWLPGWTEQIWQSSLWRVEFINLLNI